MKKVKEPDELRPQYRREDLGKGVRGKYFESYQWLALRWVVNNGG